MSLSSKDQKVLEILIDAQKRVDSKQLKGDEAKIFRSKKIMGINWERITETAMDPNKKTDSIIVSVSKFLTSKCIQLVLEEHEQALLKRYIENELK